MKYILYALHTFIYISSDQRVNNDNNRLSKLKRYDSSRLGVREFIHYNKVVSAKTRTGRILDELKKRKKCIIL